MSVAWATEKTCAGAEGDTVPTCPDKIVTPAGPFDFTGWLLLVVMVALCEEEVVETEAVGLRETGPFDLLSFDAGVALEDFLDDGAAVVDDEEVGGDTTPAALSWSNNS